MSDSKGTDKSFGLAAGALNGFLIARYSAAQKSDDNLSNPVAVGRLQPTAAGGYHVVRGESTAISVSKFMGSKPLQNSNWLVYHPDLALKKYNSKIVSQILLAPEDPCKQIEQEEDKFSLVPLTQPQRLLLTPDVDVAHIDHWLACEDRPDVPQDITQFDWSAGRTLYQEECGDLAPLLKGDGEDAGENDEKDTQKKKKKKKKKKGKKEKKTKGSGSSNQSSSSDSESTVSNTEEMINVRGAVDEADEDASKLQKLEETKGQVSRCGMRVAY